MEGLERVRATAIEACMVQAQGFEIKPGRNLESKNKADGLGLQAALVQSSRLSNSSELAQDRAGRF